MLRLDATYYCRFPATRSQTPSFLSHHSILHIERLSFRQHECPYYFKIELCLSRLPIALLWTCFLQRCCRFKITQRKIPTDRIDFVKTVYKQTSCMYLTPTSKSPYLAPKCSTLLTFQKQVCEKFPQIPITTSKRSIRSKQWKILSKTPLLYNWNHDLGSDLHQ